ncbi:MAG: sigma 54-interacting transcriptional regulator [Gemmatimonadota bacterium]|nr:sigma 54-interacting transcriptional regulator [Gemmatimonadota bacterium]
MDFANLRNRRVMIADDQKEIHDDFSEMLRPRFLETVTDDLASAFTQKKEESFLPEFELLYVNSGEEAVDVIKAEKEAGRPVSVAFVDIRMPPGIDGIETIRRVREIDRDLEVVIMTAYTDKSLAEIIHDMDLLHKVLYIRKPFAREEIQQIALSLVGKWNVEQELAEKRRQLTDSHQRLEAVLDATGDALAMYDVTGNLVFANRRFEKVLDLPKSELQKMSPKTFKERFDERFREPDLTDMEGRFIFGSKGKVVERAEAGNLPGNRLFYRSVAPVSDIQGEIIGDLYVYRDVSREIQVERMKAEVLRLRTELKATYSFSGMVGSSAPMKQVYALVKQAAESDITVLIQGESGTGKELVAKSFHFNSHRKEGPYLTINCAAIPEAPIESELFGHEEGAFTGATKRRIGVFERATGGTVFLDEVGDMDLALQARLLRVLQEREIQRVGTTTPIPVDIRLVAATNKDLEDAVKTGRFREDLFYRISVFPIAIPPLRERREDVPSLAKHFLEKHTKRNGKTISGISTATLRLLLQYDWPGNVRELENAIERAVLLETTDVLQVKNLPPQLSPIVDPRKGGAAPTSVLPLAEVERQALVNALEASDNNVTEAARALGLGRATLYRKLKKFNLTADV